MASAQELQCRHARQRVVSCVEIGGRVIIVDAFGNTHFDATHGVGQADHATKLNDCGIGDAEAGELLNGEHNTRKSAIAQGCVDRTLPAAATIGAIRDRNNHVAGDADHRGALVVRGDVHDHVDVVENGSAVFAEDGVLTLAAVATHQQQVDAALDLTNLGDDIGLVSQRDRLLGARGHVPHGDRGNACAAHQCHGQCRSDNGDDEANSANLRALASVGHGCFGTGVILAGHDVL